MVFIAEEFSVFFLSCCSSVFHAILIMIQASTLNVAFNSHNKSLLTIMMSSNVSEHTQVCLRRYLFFSSFYTHLLTKLLNNFYAALSQKNWTWPRDDETLLLQSKLGSLCHILWFFLCSSAASNTVCGDQRKRVQEIWKDQPFPNVQQW